MYNYLKSFLLGGDVGSVVKLPEEALHENALGYEHEGGVLRVRTVSEQKVPEDASQGEELYLKNQVLSVQVDYSLGWYHLQLSDELLQPNLLLVLLV